MKNLPKGMYIIYDGPQQIVMITTYHLTKKLNSMTNQMYRDHSYLGHAYNILFSECIGTHSGGVWVTMKKPLDSFFSSGSMLQYNDTLDKCVDEWFEEKFQNKKTIEISLNKLDIDKLTINFLTTVVFGQVVDLNDLVVLHEQIVPLMGQRSGIRYGFKIGYHHELELIQKLYFKWIDIIKNNSTNSSGLISHLLSNEIYQNDSKKLIHTLYETVLFNVDIMINAISMLIWDIGSDEKVQDKLIKNNKYLNHVVLESARLHPGVVNTFTDSIKNEVIIEGHKFPINTMFSFDVREINRDPNVWINPNVFNPDRFDDDATLEQKVYRFGTGPRKCIGRGPADSIIKKVIMKILASYKIKILDKEMKIAKNGTLNNLANGSMTNIVQFIAN